MKAWQRRLYDSYVSTGQVGTINHERNPYLDALIARHLPPDTRISIADLACGHGALIRALKKQGYHRVIGVDTSAEQVAAAHDRGTTEVRHGEIDPFLDDHESAGFDVVFLMDILEHLDKEQVIKLLDRVHNSLRPGGRAIIHVPNATGIFGMNARYGDFTHEVAFTPRSIRQVLSSCGFHAISVHEDKPTVHGLKSFVRRLLWALLTVPFRLLLSAETGATRHVLSQNMLVVAHH
ncbi:MAG: class I SAM-dependent methyltransferase [Gammaproteobacteria bacterium]